MLSSCPLVDARSAECCSVTIQGARSMLCLIKVGVGEDTVIVAFDRWSGIAGTNSDGSWMCLVYCVHRKLCRLILHYCWMSRGTETRRDLRRYWNPRSLRNYMWNSLSGVQEFLSMDHFTIVHGELWCLNPGVNGWSILVVSHCWHLLSIRIHNAWKKLHYEWKNCPPPPPVFRWRCLLKDCSTWIPTFQPSKNTSGTSWYR